MMTAHWKCLLYTALCIHLNVTATSAIPQSTDINPLEFKQYAQVYRALCFPHGQLPKQFKFFVACASGLAGGIVWTYNMYYRDRKEVEYYNRLAAQVDAGHELGDVEGADWAYRHMNAGSYRMGLFATPLVSAAGSTVIYGLLTLWNNLVVNRLVNSPEKCSRRFRAYLNGWKARGKPLDELPPVFRELFERCATQKLNTLEYDYAAQWVITCCRNYFKACNTYQQLVAEVIP